MSEYIDLDLLQKFQHAGDLEARNTLVERNMGLVYTIAHSYARFGVLIEDLVQEGALGLIRALETYQPEKSQFSVYAAFWIKTRLHSVIVKDWSLVKHGTTALERRLFAQLGKLPDLSDQGAVEQLARRVEGSVAEVTAIVERILRDDLSISYPISDIGTLEDLLGHDSEQQVAAEQAELQDTIAEAVQGLSDTEKFIIEQRFLSKDCLTFRECGRRLGISGQRVEQLQHRAFRKIKRFLVRYGYQESA
ncbi:MAG: sigma-70 family RNA polymerase sigma factor [Desulfomonile tiedjei]|nr:sigma-70 family RNA polymerase sigma factor [Desulfomonile tiedjei]